MRCYFGLGSKTTDIAKYKIISSSDVETKPAISAVISTTTSSILQPLSITHTTKTRSHAGSWTRASAAADTESQNPLLAPNQTLSFEVTPTATGHSSAQSQSALVNMGRAVRNVGESPVHDTGSYGSDT